MTNLNINSKTKVKSLYSKSLDYRLDLLRITFLIEKSFEDLIKRILLNEKRILKEKLENNFIDKNKKSQYLKFWENYETKEKFFVRDKGKIFLNVKNFINESTFGNLIFFLDLIRYKKLENEYKKIMPILEIKIFKNWIHFVRKVRNILAHKSNILPGDFLKKMPDPKHSQKLNTKKMSDIKLKKFVFYHLVSKTTKDLKAKKILKKYQFI